MEQSTTVNLIQNTPVSHKRICKTKLYMVMLFGEGFKCNKEHNLKANEEHQVTFFIMLLGETNKT